MRLLLTLAAASALPLPPDCGVARWRAGPSLVRVELDRGGKLNALTRSMWEALDAVLEDTDDALLITSGDAKAFSAGADVNARNERSGRTPLLLAAAAIRRFGIEPKGALVSHSAFHCPYNDRGTTTTEDPYERFLQMLPDYRVPWTLTTPFGDADHLVPLGEQAVDGHAQAQLPAVDLESWAVAPSAGVIPRSCVEIFRVLDERAALNSYEVELSMYELYRDALRDLLADRRDKKPLFVFQRPCVCATHRCAHAGPSSSRSTRATGSPPSRAASVVRRRRSRSSSRARPTATTSRASRGI